MGRAPGKCGNRYAVNLNSNYTCFLDYPPNNIHNTISKHPKGFPIPYSERLNEAIPKTMSEWPLWRNTGNFQKRISFEGFTSLLFDNYNLLYDEYPNLKDAILNNKIAYFSDIITPYDSVKNDINYNREVIFVDSNTYNNYKPTELKKSNEDTIEYIDFNPNYIKLKTHNKHQVILTLLQQYYNGWDIYIDGNKSQLFKSNFLFMSSLIEPGEHLIEFKYTNNTILISSIISSVLFLTLLAFLIIILIKRKDNKYIWPALGFFLFLLSIILFLFRDSAENKSDSGFYNKLSEILQDYPKDSIQVYINTDRKYNWSNIDYNLNHIRFIPNHSIDNFKKSLDSCKSPIAIFSSLNAYSPPEIKYLFLSKYNCLSNDYVYKDFRITIFKNSSLEKCKYKPHLVIDNGFEKNGEKWNNNLNNYDSTVFIEGRYSYLLDSNNIYSPAFESDFKSIGIKIPQKLTIYISLHVYMTKGANPVIVFDAQNSFGEKDWFGKEIRKQKSINNEWFKAHMAINIPHGYKKQDKFKIYIWNNSQSSFYIDNMKIVFDTED